MKKNNILVILLILSTEAFGQIQLLSNVDSAKNLMQSLKEDTTKANLLHQIALYYTSSNKDSALAFVKEEFDLSQRLNYTKGMANVYYDLSHYNSILGNRDQALSYAYKMLSLAEQLKDKLLLAACYSVIASGYSNLDNYKEAFQWFKKAYAIAVSSSDLTNIAGQLNNLGNAYYNIKEPDSALFFLKQSYRIFDSLNDNTSLVYPLRGLAEMSFNNNKPVEVKKYCGQIIGLSKSIGNTLMLGSTYFLLSRQYLRENKRDSSLHYAMMAVKITEALKAKSFLIDSYEMLVKIYQINHQTDSSFKYETKIVLVKDSIEAENHRSQLQSVAFEQKMQEKEKTDAVQKAKEALQTRVIIFSLLAALLVFGVIAFILYRNNAQKQQAKTKIEHAYAELKSTQSQLIQSEKMASLGELTAGIAHEIQNPLNFVNNFSDVNTELIDEAGQEIDKGNISEAKFILSDIKENEEKINHHGKRAGDIVKGMLQHSRASSGTKEPTDINALADEYLRLSYHFQRAKDKSFNAEMITDFDESIGKINIIPQDIGRVLLNLFNNAFYAVNEQNNRNLNLYKPTVSVTTKKSENSVLITVSDNGNGIPKNIVDKIFQPFFTTKPTGQGTGLGLSLSYDIIKAHGGEIKVESKEGEGSKFIIQIPVKETV